MTDKNRVYIFDTTMRDGEQSPGASMSLEEKIQIARVFDELGICRYYSLPSRFTIVLYGNSEEDEFFETLLSRVETNLCDIPKVIAKTIFKYYGGVKIEGSLDYLYLKAAEVHCEELRFCYLAER